MVHQITVAHITFTKSIDFPGEQLVNNGSLRRHGWDDEGTPRFVTRQGIKMSSRSRGNDNLFAGKIRRALQVSYILSANQERMLHRQVGDAPTAGFTQIALR